MQPSQQRLRLPDRASFMAQDVFEDLLNLFFEIVWHKESRPQITQMSQIDLCHLRNLRIKPPLHPSNLQASQANSPSLSLHPLAAFVLASPSPSLHRRCIQCRWPSGEAKQRPSPPYPE